MSKIGKEPITIPEKVEVRIDRNLVVVESANGSLQLTIPHFIEVEKENSQIIVTRKREDDRAKSMHGTVRARLANMVKGVVEDWTKELVVKGTGYRISQSGKGVSFDLGFSHPVQVDAPEGINFKIEGDKLIVGGADKVKVGNLAAKIRHISPPDAYHGKGIRYADEVVKLKPGKMAKVGGAGE